MVLYKRSQASPEIPPCREIIEQSSISRRCAPVRVHCCYWFWWSETTVTSGSNALILMAAVSAFSLLSFLCCPTCRWRLLDVNGIKVKLSPQRRLFRLQQGTEVQDIPAPPAPTSTVACCNFRCASSPNPESMTVLIALFCPLFSVIPEKPAASATIPTI